MTEENQTQQHGKIQQLLFTLGKSYLERHQDQEAYDKFLQLMELDPDNEEVCFYTAIAAIRLEETSDEAQSLYERALRHNPDSEELLHNLSGLFEKHGIDTAFAKQVRARMSGADSPHPSKETPAEETTEPQETDDTTDETSLRDQLESLWRQGKFKQAKQLIKERTGQESDSDHLLETALTHAYEHLTRNRELRKQSTIEIITRAAKQLLPPANMQHIRDYLTLRVLLPATSAAKNASAQECDEYKFILGLIPMEEFFASILNNGVHDEQSVFTDALFKSLANTTNDAEYPEVSAAGDWFGFQFVQLTSRAGKAVPQRVSDLVNTYLSKSGKSYVRNAGACFVSLATDPKSQIQATIQLMRSLDAYNEAVAESERIYLYCGLEARDTTDKDATENTFLHMLNAANLLAVALRNGNKSDSGTGLFLARTGKQVADSLWQAGVTFLPADESELCPWEPKGSSQIFWPAPLATAVSKKNVLISDIQLQECIGKHRHYATFIGKNKQLARLVVVRAMDYQTSVVFMQDKEKREQLFESIRRIGRMSHPNIATLFDMGQQDNTIFYAREYVDGTTPLEIDRSHAEWEYELATVLLKVINALNYAQNQGVHHLNLKPSNIRLHEAQGLKLVDFHLAGFNETNPDEITRHESGWNYLAPEVLLDGEGDVRSDIYSLGVIAYEILTQRHPLEAAGVHNLDDMLQTELEFLELEQVPIWQAWVQKAMHLDCDLRFQTLSEAEMALRKLQLELLPGDFTETNRDD